MLSMLLCAATAMAAETPAELAKELKKDWDLLGVQVDAAWAHSNAFIGPRYQLVSKLGLMVDAAGGVGVRFADIDEGPLFGQGYGRVGWTLSSRLKNRKGIFNLYQESDTNLVSGSTTTTFHYLETEVLARRNLIVYGGARTMFGSGPEVTAGTYADSYFAVEAGVSILTTWRQVQEKKGYKRLMRGIRGFEFGVLYAPQESLSEDFSNFRHWGGEIRFVRTTELGALHAPFHLTVGMEPGLGPKIQLGMMFPALSPLAGPARARMGGSSKDAPPR